jgi:adenine-specific DNA-methyltransferase
MKRFKSEVRAGVVPQTIWGYDAVGHTQDAKQEIIAIMGYGATDEVFVTPKPRTLLGRVLELATGSESLVLDSFAGSATTAHAVLSANRKDGGDRRFIIVETEDYADTLTAERVRRAIKGYPFQGTQREELLRERITYTSLKRADTLLTQVQGFENLDGYRFDRIARKVDKGELVVTGEKDVEERTDGLGGDFTYCELGQPLELERLLKGSDLPSFEALGSVLFHMATSSAFDARVMERQPMSDRGLGYLGEASGSGIWLLYEPDLEFLKSREAALTLSMAKAIAALKPDMRHVVYAPARFVSQKLLNEERVPVEFAPLPYAMYRIELG